MVSSQGSRDSDEIKILQHSIQIFPSKKVLKYSIHINPGASTQIPFSFKFKKNGKIQPKNKSGIKKRLQSSN